MTAYSRTTIAVFLFCSGLFACKVAVQDKKQQTQTTPTPASLTSWDGRSDRTDASWMLQALR